MPRPIEANETEWTPVNILIAVVVIGLMIAGALWMHNSTLASIQLRNDVYHAGDRVVQALDHPQTPVTLPGTLAGFGPLQVQEVAGQTAVQLGPLDSEHCMAIMTLFTMAPYSERAQVWLNDATAATWDLRYKEAMNYYAAQGPHGSYEPSPCELVSDTQRVVRIVRTP